MNNRLTIQEVAGFLSRQTGKKKREAEQFLREFVTAVTEGVFTHREVKIKELGTFRIIPVEQRESVDVNTGRRILIPAHNKLTWLPDKALKEWVNKPFAAFEATKIENGSALEETERGHTNEENNEQMTAVHHNPPVQEPASQPAPESIPAAQEQGQPASKPAPVNPSPAVNRPKQDGGEEDKIPPSLIIGLIVAALVAFLAVYLCLWGNPFSRSARKTVAVEQPFVPVDSAQATAAEPQPDAVPPTAGTPAKAAVTRQRVTKTPLDKNTLAVVQMQKGSRLTLLSLRYFKHKAFWVYIYDHNKAIIDNPNLVSQGQEIRIPKPALYNIDANNPTSVRKALEREAEIKKRFDKH